MTTRFCDFCNAMPGEWKYPTINLEWLACAGCSKLIEEENLKELVKRCVDTYLEKMATHRTRQQLEYQTMLICVEFQKHRTHRRRLPYDPRKEE